jgi:hypothetical protein
MAPGKSGVDSYNFEDIWALRSLELPRLFGFSAEFPELSDLCALWEYFGALRLAKKERDGSRVCFGDSLGDGGYGGIAVKPGVGGSVAIPGDAGKVGLFETELESCVTGRMVAPLKNGELEEDLGECGVRGLRPSEL